MLRASLRLMGLRSSSLSSFRDDPQDRARNRFHRHPDTDTDSGLRAERAPGMTTKDQPGPVMTIENAAATRLALVVSAAWLLLPINLMAVLYVVQRMESLCQIFVLAGLWAYLRGRWMMLTAADAKRDRRGFALAVSGIVLGTLIGLTSKETAVLLPVFCFLAEVIVMRFGRGMARCTPPLAPAGETDSGFRPSAGPGMTMEGKADPGMKSDRAAGPGMAMEGEAGNIPLLRHSGAARSAEPGIGLQPATNPTSTRHDRRIWALFAVTLFIPAVLGTAWLLRSALNPASWSGRDFTLGQRLLTEARVLVDYLHWTLLPNPEVLSLYHDEIVKSTGWLTPWTTLASIVFLAALIGVAIWLRRRRPLVALGIGWFFAAQLLTATIIPLELVYEQRMYFASIGVLLAAGSLLLGLRWKIEWGLLRGFLVAAAVLWFAVATNLRAHEWSNPLKLAVAEANRHPESPRAVYEAGRLLLIASNYEPGKVRDNAWKYLREAAAIPGASALPDQAMIMLADHRTHGDDAAFWQSMTAKLRDQPTRQEDVSALISLTNCYGAGICKFNTVDLDRAYQAVLSRPHPIARLNGAYADFQRDILHNDTLAIKYLALAVKGDPSEPAYRIDLCALYARNGETGLALQQIDALRRLNYAGRLDRQIGVLERLVEQGKSAPSR
jgi:hypothetical protein